MHPQLPSPSVLSFKSRSLARLQGWGGRDLSLEDQVEEAQALVWERSTLCYFTKVETYPKGKKVTANYVYDEYIKIYGGSFEQ